MSRRSPLLLGCLLLAGAMFNLTLIVAGLKELVIDELGGSVADAARFFTVEMVAYLIFAPIWGALSDRWGRRKPFVVIGYLVAGAAYLGYLAVPSIPWLLVLRFVQGAAAIAGWSTMLALLFDGADTASRSRVAGLAGASLILGVGLGAPIGGVLAKFFGARAPLAVAGGLFLLLGLLALRLRDESTVAARPRLGEILRSLLSRPRLLLPWGVYFAERFSVGMFVVVFPLFLESTTGADPAARGRALGLFLLPFVVAQLATYRLSRRLGPYRLLVGGAVLYGCALAMLARVPPGGVPLLLVGLGLLAAAIFPPTMSLTAEWSPPQSRGSAMAGFNFAGSLGFALGPLVGAWAGTRSGYLLAFDIAAAVVVAAAAGTLVVALAVRRR